MLLTDSWHILLSDFGSAKVLSPEEMAAHNSTDAAAAPAPAPDPSAAQAPSETSASTGVPRVSCNYVRFIATWPRVGLGVGVCVGVGLGLGVASHKRSHSTSSFSSSRVPICAFVYVAGAGSGSGGTQAAFRSSFQGTAQYVSPEVLSSHTCYFRCILPSAFLYFLQYEILLQSVFLWLLESHLLLRAHVFLSRR